MATGLCQVWPMTLPTCEHARNEHTGQAGHAYCSRQCYADLLSVMLASGAAQRRRAVAELAPGLLMPELLAPVRTCQFAHTL